VCSIHWSGNNFIFRVSNLMIFRRCITKLMQRAGYSPYFEYRIFEKRFNDIFKNKETAIRQKLWSQKRGFLSKHTSLYGLTEENFDHYLSYFDYYKLHPINGPFSHWIDDKLTIKLILHPFSDYFPEYYYHFYHGEILKLSDCPVEYSPTIVSIIELLRKKKTLAGKPLSGSLGRGFVKFGYEGGNFLINNKFVSESEIRNMVQNWMCPGNTGYLITEYLKAHSNLRQIWSETPNTIRISVLRDKFKTPKIINAYIIDNTGAGGICRIDYDSGVFNDGKLFTNNQLEDCKFHTDNHSLLEGVIPHWILIKGKILEISSYIPQVIYMGFDIVVTEDGFKILEINSHEGIEFNQYYSPYMKHEPTKSFFMRLINKNRE